MPEFSEEQLKTLLEQERRMSKLLSETMSTIEKKEEKEPDIWNKIVFVQLESLRKFCDKKHPLYVAPHEKTLVDYVEMSLEASKLPRLLELLEVRNA